MEDFRNIQHLFKLLNYMVSLWVFLILTVFIGGWGGGGEIHGSPNQSK